MLDGVNGLGLCILIHGWWSLRNGIRVSLAIRLSDFPQSGAPSLAAGFLWIGPARSWAVSMTARLRKAIGDGQGVTVLAITDVILAPAVVPQLTRTRRPTAAGKGLVIRAHAANGVRAEILGLTPVKPARHDPVNEEKLIPAFRQPGCRAGAHDCPSSLRTKGWLGSSMIRPSKASTMQFSNQNVGQKGVGK